MSVIISAILGFFGKAIAFLIKNPWIILVIALALLWIAFMAQSGTLKAERATLSKERTAFAQEKSDLEATAAALHLSESRRAVEYSLAIDDAGNAAKACAARVSEARRSGSAIRQILETPIVQDPATHCPVRALIGADRLRDALTRSPAT